MALAIGQFPLLENGRWTGEWSPPVKFDDSSPSLHALRSPGRYYVVSDVQLKRDLKGRTLAHVYRENRALRGPEKRYVPKHRTYGLIRKNKYSEPEYGEGISGGLGEHGGPFFPTIRDEYLAWCKSRNHTPHPASLDPDHPINKWRERAPKAERT